MEGNISLQISSGNQCLTDRILIFFLASHQLGFFTRKQRAEEENHEDWAQLLLPSQQSFAMTTNASPPHARHRDSPGIGLDTQTQQGPPGPKSIWGSNWNALPTISRVGSTYVNFKEKPKCVKPQFFYLIYRLIHGFTIQSLFSYVCLTVFCVCSLMKINLLKISIPVFNLFSLYLLIHAKTTRKKFYLEFISLQTETIQSYKL